MEPIYNIYIDKQFIDKLSSKLTGSSISSLKNRDETEIYNSFYDFLKNLVFVNVFTNISEDDLNDPDKDYKYMLNRGKFFPRVRPEIFEDLYEYAEDLDQPGFTLFLAENKKDIKNKPKLSHMFLSFDDIEFRWSKILSYSLRSLGPFDTLLNNWRFLDSIRHPLNTIIIVDPYLKSCVTTLDANLKILLNKLLRDYNRVSRLDVVLFFDKNLVNANPALNNISCKVFFDWMKNLLAAEHVVDYNLVFIDSKHLKASKLDKEHNRFIITNYWKIKSGRSFDFLNSDGFVDGSYDDVSLSFVFDPKSSQTVIDDIFRLNQRFYGDSKRFDFTEGELYNRLIEISD